MFRTLESREYKFSKVLRMILHENINVHVNQDTFKMRIKCLSTCKEQIIHIDIFKKQFGNSMI